MHFFLAQFKINLYFCKQFAYLCEKMVEVEDHLKKWKAYYTN